ncbi:hypothetical protein HYALB_00007623 [Hymenoscyphus albidus]|uniref:FAS1 domain-containing protein n=1 Tax=Hymenoscyphus albidus TaxID=595503 RepID=A0A9N9LNZ9_9HELO|nr:hypothetical protein HYALB_00007623 [Hymenoscyphus albidus]
MIQILLGENHDSETIRHNPSTTIPIKFAGDTKTTPSAAMKYLPILSLLLTTITALKLQPPNQQHQQHPMSNPPNLGPAIPPPPSNDPSDTNPPPSDSAPIILSDILGSSRKINIFAGFTRDFAPISQRFEDRSLNTTILAPLNSAIMALPRKPWEDPAEYEKLGEQAYEGGDGQGRAQENLRRFVESHVVPDAWEKGLKYKTLAGDEVWWERKGGQRIIQPGNIEVDSVSESTANGEVWVLKGVRNYK